MNTIKGFVSVSQYTNNTPGSTSLLCELSTWSQTYSKECGEYTDSSLPGYKLSTFRSLDGNGNMVSLQQSQVVQILDLVRVAIVYASGHIRPYDSVDFRNNLVAEFYNKAGNIQFGEFIDNGSLALPAWISWNSLDHDNALIKVWLSDQAFQDQYDDFEIEVITPLDNLDAFFNTFNNAIKVIESRTLAQLGDIIQDSKSGHPETYLRIMKFDFLNILNLTQKHATNWAVLVYGKNGDNTDAIKDAIIAHVLANSTHPRSEWEVILPDLFKRTEFVMFPRWDKTSIPNLTETAGLYGSILNPYECVQFVKDHLPSYTPSFIELNTNILPFDYKGISLVAVNGMNNIDGKTTLNMVFPDYIPVPSTSGDFNRMQIFTRDWILLIEKMLITAETATGFSTMPNQQRRIYRDGVMFISAMYDNVNYLIAAKSNSFYD